LRMRCPAGRCHSRSPFIRANVALSTVTPLKGVTYINKLKPGYPEEVEEREAVDVREPVDYIHKSAGGFHQVSWCGGLGTEVHATGLNDVVIWNPGKDGERYAD
jgi:glucose-6-phosphate 1-epimerase